MRLIWIFLLHILHKFSPITLYVLLACFIGIFEIFNRIMESMIQAIWRQRYIIVVTVCSDTPSAKRQEGQIINGF